MTPMTPADRPLRSKVSAVAVLLLLLGVSGCEYHFGDTRSYEVAASTPEGAELLRTSTTNYICEDAYGLLWADFYRSNCFFAADVTRTAEGIEFRRIREEALPVLGLEARMSWWDKYGLFIAIPGLLLIIALMVRFGLVPDFD